MEFLHLTETLMEYFLEESALFRLLGKLTQKQCLNRAIYLRKSFIKINEETFICLDGDLPSKK